MPRVKYTERKSGGRDSEAIPSGGTGDLRASARGVGSGLGGERPEGEEEEEAGASVVVGGSPEASGRKLSGATDSGRTGGPDTHGPRPEASTGGTGAMEEASDDERVDICSGRARPAPVSRFGVECPEVGCGRLFTRRDNADRHCVRFHEIHLDGTPASAAEVAIVD